MILVGIEGCDLCHKYKGLHPEYKYVEFKLGKVKSSSEILEIKKALTKLGFDGQFPALISDDLNRLASYDALVPEYVEKIEAEFDSLSDEELLKWWHEDQE